MSPIKTALINILINPDAAIPDALRGMALEAIKSEAKENALTIEQLRGLWREAAKTQQKFYSVVGYYESTGKICADKLEAESATQAMSKVASQVRDTNPDYVLVYAHRIRPNDECDFPGESTTDCETYLGTVAEEGEELPQQGEDTQHV